MMTQGIFYPTMLVKMKINEISQILENSNLNDRATIKRLEELTASERAFAAESRKQD